MIHYYTNREVSGLLQINLARWKRWTRCFLPPDPLGGMQSGYARQYTFKDLFKVFFGGHLLGHVKLSVVESRQVLDDLSPWLKKNGFFRINGSNKRLVGTRGKEERFRIFFAPGHPTDVRSHAGFRYLIRKTIGIRIEEGSTGGQIIETIEETPLFDDATGKSPASVLDDPFVHLVNLTALYTFLVKKVRG